MQMTMSINKMSQRTKSQQTDDADYADASRGPEYDQHKIKYR